MSEKNKNRKSRITAEACKRFGTVMCGSIFVQIFCWALYSYLRLNSWFCCLSAVVTALLYHFLQVEEETGLSRKNVFFAAILCPFLIGALLTGILMYRYRNLQHLSAELDGVSEFTELISLYSARLLMNGAVLLIFAAVHSFYLKKNPPKPVDDPEEKDEDDA
ncbi:MAG: hypothetical protein IKI58_01215 [Oscillospiraceae bacterium]|nr:hypothetical protein [Oscillospiraceae bacterium]